MDEKTLRSLIEQVAVIKQIGVDIGSNGKVLPAHQIKKSKKVIQKAVDDFGEEIEQEIEIPMTNPTLGYRVVGLKENNKICELGCGKVVSNQVILKKKFEKPVPHWRTSCATCKSGLSPDKTRIIKNGMELQNAYSAWFRSLQDK